MTKTIERRKMEQEKTETRGSRQRREGEERDVSSRLLICVNYSKWDSLLPKGFKPHQFLISTRRAKTVQAVAIPTSSSPADSAGHRKQLAERYGFKQIGEPLPENIKLKDIIDSLPRRVFEIDDMKAWKSVLISVTSYALGLLMISKAPSGLGVDRDCSDRSHDCAHRSFSRNKLVEDVIGTLAFLPLIYPYEPWRIKHERHHAKTNMLFEDIAWHPVLKEEYDSYPVLQKAVTYAYGTLRLWMSISHWLIWHFDMTKFKPNEVSRVRISLAYVFAFMAIGWPLIIYKTGVIGWINFWLMPWLVYHIWISTFTMVHHTAPHIPFKSSDEWNAAQAAQLNRTVHCDYPPWGEKWH